MNNEHVHLIANSHIDPVWLWDKYEGIDEVINTFRSACDRLDEYPELCFSASSACFYAWVEKYAPDVFKRIEEHVNTGRWEIVGGWWVEMDTNLPGSESFYKSAEISKCYFRERFGVDALVAYSPDTFGHPATLPKILAKSGFKYYIFCRPDRNENPNLPSGVFYWDYEGYSVLCHRVSYHYTQGTNWGKAFQNAISDPKMLTNGIGCYMFGVGDHGGGPSKDEIEFLLARRRELGSPKLLFSRCLDYFKEMEAMPEIPVITGDLHIHAVGCYSVNRCIKHAIRHAENSLCHIRRLLDICRENQKVSDHLWKTVIFNEFHDIMPGSCAPLAAEQALAELKGVQSAGADIAYEASKKIAGQLPVQCKQGEFRVINSLDHDVKAPFQIESWPYFDDHAVFMDSDGRDIPIQEITPSVNCQNHRWMFIDTIPAKGIKLYHFDSIQFSSAMPSGSYFFTEGDTIKNDKHVIKAPGMVADIIDGMDWFSSPISLGVVQDDSDTWSHGLQGYGGPSEYFVQKEASVSCGNLASFLISKQEYRRSSAELMYTIYNDLPYIDLQIKVKWMEIQSVLKLILEIPNLPSSILVQGADGCISKSTEVTEEPLHGWIAAGPIKIFQDGAFALDRIGDKLRITLIRSSLYAYCGGWPIDKRGPLNYTDLGEHGFRLRFLRQQADSEK